MAADHLTISHRNHWPEIRVELEHKLAAVIHQFIANGSFASESLRDFAKKVSAIEGDLAHLDAVECKARQIKYVTDR